MAPQFQIFSIYFFNHFIKNQKTTIAITFLTHIISNIGGVSGQIFVLCVNGSICRKSSMTLKYEMQHQAYYLIQYVLLQHHFYISVLAITLKILIQQYICKNWAYARERQWQKEFFSLAAFVHNSSKVIHPKLYKKDIYLYTRTIDWPTLTS